LRRDRHDEIAWHSRRHGRFRRRAYLVQELRRLGFDLVKIDGAFIQNLARSPDDRFFVRTLLDLARHLNIEAVAEWVEDHERAALLAEWGVDYAQGNFFGEARPPAALTASAAA
jgi:EAL domain-containing protein (putative c-di-GMP-specific phosphodiesterase class I)